jgi:hypothetical protein
MIAPNTLLLNSALELIGANGISVAEFRLISGLNDKYGYGFEDHQRGLAFLISQGFVIEVDGLLRCGQLERKEWLVGELVSGNNSAWTFVDFFPKSRWKFNPDDSLKSELGLLGEKFVLNELQNNLDIDLRSQIKHASLLDDGLGYDIESPSSNESRGTVYLEVKTTSRPGQHFDFYISRNEASVGSRLRQWHLVFVKVDNQIPQLLGHCPYSEISQQLPIDRSPGFEWQSTSCRINPRDLFLGLP